MRADRVMSLAWRGLVPSSLLALAAVVFVGTGLLVAGSAGSAGPGGSIGETLIGGLTLALTLAVALHIVTRVSHSLRTVDPVLDPFV